jgi:hypothetical protein
MNNERTLTVVNYSCNEDDVYLDHKTRVTIAPEKVSFVVASFDPVSTVDGKDLYKANVIMTNEANLELFVSLMDLTTLERVVGMWFQAE